jgi:hypothetical protein
MGKVRKDGRDESRSKREHDGLCEVDELREPEKSGGLLYLIIYT